MFFIQILRKLCFTELFEAGDPIIGNNVSMPQFQQCFKTVVSKSLLNLEVSGLINTKY